MFSGRDIQLGYVSSQRAALIAPMLDRGRIVTAIFQEPMPWGCAVRVAFDGEKPALPPVRERNDVEPDFEGDEGSGFWPDPEYDE